jgi:hypothetical protein
MHITAPTTVPPTDITEAAAAASAAAAAADRRCGLTGDGGGSAAPAAASALPVAAQVCPFGSHSGRLQDRSEFVLIDLPHMRQIAKFRIKCKACSDTLCTVGTCSSKAAAYSEGCTSVS